MNKNKIELARELLISRVSSIRIFVHQGRPIFLPEGAQVPSDVSSAAVVAHNQNVLNTEISMCFRLSEMFASFIARTDEQEKVDKLAQQAPEEPESIPAKKVASKKKAVKPSPDLD
jgi:hypothetical protein